MRLIEAARAGQTERVRQLIAAGADVNARDAQGSTALIAATEDAKWDTVRVLLEAGADVTLHNQHGMTALHGAVGCGSTEISRALLEAGAHTEISGAMGPVQGTPLAWAACQGKIAVVRVLLKAGAQVDAGDENHVTPLMKAVLGGYRKTVCALLDAGADANVRNVRGVTALMVAASLGRRGIVADLLEAGADTSAQMDNGNTALLGAVSNKKTEIARLLIEAGADVNAATSEGKTPLFDAVAGDRRELVQMLLDAGADLNVAFQEYDSLDNDLIKGTTPLMLAVAKRRARSFEALLEARADVSARNDRGQTALSLAAAKGLTKYIKRLRAAGANEAIDERGFQSAALLKAAERGNVEEVRACLRAGADPNIRNTEACHHGKTPLIHAAERGHVAVIHLLLEAGADVNATETSSHFVGNGWTALVYAACRGHAAVLRALLQAGADVNVRDRQQTTALIQAAGAGHGEVAQILIQAGAELNMQAQQGGQTALTQAAAQGHLHVVQALLAAGAARAGNVLVAAAEACHPTTVRLLLDTGIPADARETKEPGRTALIAATEVRASLVVPATDVRLDERDKTPWLAAVEAKQNEILHLLLQAGANIDARDTQGRTALLATAAKNNLVTISSEPDEGARLHHHRETIPLSALQLLLDAGAHIQAQDTRGNTALMQVADIDTRFCPAPVEALGLLLEAGARVDVRNHQAETALFLAAARGDEDVLRLLLRAGADVNARDNKGRTPLLHGLESGQAQGPLALLRAGAEVNLADHEGKTALFHAIAQRASTKVIQALLTAGADCLARTAEGSTPLDLAHDVNFDEAVELLQAAGATDDRAQDRALLPAVERGDRDQVRRLLAEGAGCEYRTYYSQDSLGLALAGGQFDILADLLAAGADVNRRYANDAPRLCTAVQTGQIESVRLLLAAGADIEATDARGWTALRHAALGNYKEIAEALVAAGATVDPITAICLKPIAFAEAAKLPEYRAAVAELAQACAAPAAPIDWQPGAFSYRITPGQEGEEQVRTGNMSRFWADEAVLQEKVKRIMDRYQAEFLERGYFVWDIGRGIGCGPAGRFLGLAPTANKYAVIAAMRTNGGNYEVYTPDIIAFLQDMERDDPFALLGCGGEFLDIELLQLTRDPQGLAERLYKICSDMVEQGTVTLEALVEQLRTQRRVHFWWD